MEVITCIIYFPISKMFVNVVQIIGREIIVADEREQL